jgi:acetyltransferase-like isoleucine patch superfamily enzyme
VGDWAAVDGAAPTWSDIERPIREQTPRRASIRIGAGAVIGPHAVVGPGAAIPAGASVDAYAVLPPPPPATVAGRARRR